MSFSSGTTSYTVTVAYPVTEVIVTPVANHARATLAVNAEPVESGQGSPAIPLGVGATTINVVVTAEDASTKTYAIVVTRQTRTTQVIVETEEFALSCPSTVNEGADISCTLTNTHTLAADWPVVAILHSSADGDARALITEDSLIPASSPAFGVDLGLSETQTPAMESYNYGYGELFSGGSTSVYTTYGYEKFDWSGQGAANAERTVVIQTIEDNIADATETFYVAVAPSDYTGLSQLADNKAPIMIRPAPTFVATETAERTVAENTAAGQSIGNPVTATNPDGNTLTYGLGGTDGASFAIDSSSGQLQTAAALNYETKATYEVEVTATDSSSGTSATLPVTIRVLDENEAPAFPATETAERTVAENTAAGQSIGLPVTATDPDTTPLHTTLTYSLGGTDGTSFAIDSSSGQLQTAAALDYETKATYRVTVSVRDGKDAAGSPDSTADATTAVKITVTGVDEPPAVSGPATVAYAEDGTGAVATYSATDPEGDSFRWSVSDTTAFAITPDGELTFTASPDYEAQNRYTVTVTATGSGDNAGTLAVTVSITNEEEPGTVTLTGTPPQTGRQLKATLSDPDGVLGTTTWKWERQSPGQSIWTNIPEAASDQYTPQAADVGGYLRVTASYTDGEGSGKSARAAPAAAVLLPPSTQVVLAVDRATVSEGVGSTGQAVEVTGTLDGATRAQTTVVQVTVAGSGGAGVVGFEAVASFPLTIAAGTASGTATFTLMPADDTTDEGDETVTVGGTTADLDVIPAELTITDDEPAPTVTLVLSAENDVISENAGMSTVTATLNHPSSRVTTVAVAVEAVAPAVVGDFTLSPNRTLTIVAGDTVSSGPAVTLTAVDNDTDAPDKQVTVSGTASNTQGLAEQPAAKILTIADDDAPPTVTLVLSPPQIAETKQVSTVTATLNHESSEATTVVVSASAVDPAVDSDFRLSTNTTLTIPAGATASMGTVTLTSVDNDTDAPAKQVTVSGTARNTQGYMGPAEETLLLTDDEGAPTVTKLAWSVTPITEAGGQSTLTVTLSHPSSAEIVVTLTAAPAEAVTPSPAEVRIPAGQTVGSVTLTAEPNDIDGPETTAVTVTAAVVSYLLGTIASATAPPLTITDDDDPPTVMLLLDPASISEDGGQSTVTATLSHLSSTPIVVTVADASAYTLGPNRSLTFAPEEVASQGMVTLEAVDNDIDAADAPVEVGGTASNNLDVSLTVTEATLTLTDDDTRGVTVSPTTLSIREGDTATYTVVLASEPTETVTVAVTVPSTAVDRVNPERLTFTPATWETPQAVTVTAVDDEVQNTSRTQTDTLTHTVTTVTGGDYAGETAAAVAVTVTDDESPSTTVQLRVAPGVVSEGGDRPVTVTGKLDGTVREGATVVTLAVRAGTATAADFTATVAPLTIAAATTTGSAVVTLTALADSIHERDETVLVSGSTTVGLTVTEATVTIRDNTGAPEVRLEVAPESISESGTENSTTVTARLNHRSSEATTVDVTATPVHPAVAADFTLSGTRLTIPAGKTESEGNTVTLTVMDNPKDEADKQVTVSGTATNALNIAGNPADVRLSITDDDPPEVEPQMEKDRAPRYVEGETGPVATYTATNPANVRLTWAVTGPDADNFTIQNGVLEFKEPPDHEASRGSVYAVTVEAADGTSPDPGTLAVTVTVEDALGSVDLPPAQPQVGVALTATVSDPDGVGMVTEWRWERSFSPDFPTDSPDLDPPEPVRNSLLDHATDTYIPVSADLGYFLRATVDYTDGQGTFKAAPVAAVTAETVQAQPRRSRPQRSGRGGGSGGGGGGGGPACAEDVHGNSAAQATAIALDAETIGAICPAADVDYFTVTAPGRGLVFVDTTGSVPTRGTLRQNDVVLASGPISDQGQAERLGALVQAGPVVVAVASQGGATGAYGLAVTFVVGYLENPGAESFQSGVGVLSGWVCEADMVEMAIAELPAQVAGYGTERVDTAGVCGDTDNGFGLLFNWNRLGDGDHTVVAYVDGVELAQAMVTVTTLGAEFLRDVAGTCEAADFPTPGETVTLAWQQNNQNFVIAGGSAPAGVTPGRTSALPGFLENPGHHSFQSGVGVLSGWVCAAEVVELAIGTLLRQEAAYGTERVDTQAACGDTNNGFGLLFNWNRLGDGEHTVVAYVDDEELGRATVQVTTLDEEFVRGAEGMCEVEDFPLAGQTVTLEWQQNSQNFVITEVD